VDSVDESSDSRSAEVVCRRRREGVVLAPKDELKEFKVEREPRRRADWTASDRDAMIRGAAVDSDTLKVVVDP
jgi:hypothetical protein